MNNKRALIIFVRNPVLGKVKTRLAVSIGQTAALAVYNILLQHTLDLSKELNVHKIVFYADALNSDDCWNGYEKAMQSGSDLGERMLLAFQYVLNKGFSQVAIIGSDCYELSAAIVTDAFEALDKTNIVIGPASDGGYYLLGMQTPLKNVFALTAWSTAAVFSNTMDEIKRQAFSYVELPVLSDIDTEKDIPQRLRVMAGIN